jgi:hypothetical protein
MNAAYRVPDSHLVTQPDDPLRHFEPIDAQIAARTAYLNPLLLASRSEAGSLLSTMDNTPEWYAFAAAVHGNDLCEAGQIARQMLETATSDEAERLAEAGLYGISSVADDEILHRIGATPITEWLRDYEARTR